MTLTTMISQPVWILVSLIGVADILILAWCITLIRRNRRHNQRDAACRDDLAIAPEQSMHVGQFRHDLAFLQIDAVFDGLAALIETERIKLKSMIQPPAAPVRTESPSPQKTREDTREVVETAFRPSGPAPSQGLPLDQEIARFADSGEKPAAIAGRLGISQAEVDLALKMRTGDNTPAGCKLEAVA
jgi:hypothetical protein